MNTPSYASASLYVGDLHPDVTEAQLFEIFKQLGPVASIRVCRDAITRRSLGYAYVNYHNVVDAERAIDLLNYKEIKGKPCRIMWSQRDPAVRRSNEGNIFIKNLHKGIDNKALYDTFATFGNILSCKVATDENANSKGYGFVHYDSKEAADNAIAKVNGKLLNGKKCYVGPFQPRKERTSDEIEQKWTNIYVKHLDKAVDDDKLKEMFSKFGKITSAVITKDDQTGESKGFGFVNFETHEDAKNAVDEMNEKEIDGKQLYVGKAQKKAERERELKDMFLKIQRERMSKYQGVNLYVKNLEETVDDEKIRQEFSTCGTITSAKVMRDDKSNSKGFGFVCFATPEEATKAVTEMNGKMIGNKPIYVALAQRKEQRRAQLELQHQQRNAAARMQGMGAPGGLPMGYPHPAGAVFYGGRPPNFVYPHHPQMMGGGGRPRFPTQPQARGMPYGQPGAPMPGFMPVPGNMPAGGQPGMGMGGPGPQGPRGGQQGKGPRTPKGGPMNQRGGGNNPNNVTQPGTVPFKYNANVRNQQIPVIPQPVNPELGVISAEDRKHMIGEQLFPMIAGLLRDRKQEDLTGKITGMILESMDSTELVQLLESQEALMEKVEEGVYVLQKHAADVRKAADGTQQQPESTAV